MPYDITGPQLIKWNVLDAKPTCGTHNWQGSYLEIANQVQATILDL